MPGKAPEDGPSSRATAVHVGDPDGILDPWFPSGPALVIAAVWGGKLQMERFLFLPLSLLLCILPFKETDLFQKKKQMCGYTCLKRGDQIFVTGWDLYRKLV